MSPHRHRGASPEAPPRGRGRPPKHDNPAAVIRDYAWFLASRSHGFTPAKIAAAEPRYSETTVRRGIESAEASFWTLLGVRPTRSEANP